MLARSCLLSSLLALVAGPTGAQDKTNLFCHYDGRCVQLGAEMLGLGDVNQDGHGDYLVAAPEEISTGNCYVMAISGRDGMQLWRVNGSQNSRFGSVLRTGADYNTDGIRDVLVGAPQWTSGAGLVQILSATDGQSLGLITGAAGDGLGVSVADAGDLNQDGRPDVLVGASAFPNGTNWGKAMIVSGANNFSTVLRTYNGAFAGARLGQTVAAAGDVDNDGFPDCVIGEPGRDEVRVYSGQFNFLHYRLTGTEEFGYGLGRPGDVDADGDEDLLVSSSSNGNGNVFAYDLRTGAPLFQIPGGGGSWLGRKFAGMGDLDNDGGADFAVSLSGRNQVNIYSGRTRAILYSFSDWGQWNNTGFGSGIGAADVDGDGRRDLLVGAPGHCFQGGPRDQFACSFALRKWPFSADGHMLSVRTGGIVNFRIDVGSAHGSKWYFVVGSMSGTQPGFPFLGHHVPLNIDAYFTYTVGSPNGPLLPSGFGVLSPLGVATCGFQIVPNTPVNLVGTRIDHAAVVLCPFPQPFCVGTVTNARPLTLVQ